MAENTETYREFILELLQTEAKSNSDVAVVYPILAQRQHLLNPRFSEILQQLAEGFIAENPDETANIIALIENLSIHISNFPLGKRAIACYHQGNSCSCPNTNRGLRKFTLSKKSRFANINQKIFAATTIRLCSIISRLCP